MGVQPAADTYAETTKVSTIWPGTRYVDVLGIDGFNWGRDSSWGRWRSFRQVFQPMYDQLTGLDPRLPVWICEFSSKEPRRRDGSSTDRRHDKGTWIKQAFRTTTMPRVRALVWFDIRKERDWRAASSRSSLRALRKALR